jgi:hypothetical protein
LSFRFFGESDEVLNSSIFFWKRYDQWFRSIKKIFF